MVDLYTDISTPNEPLPVEQDDDWIDEPDDQDTTLFQHYLEEYSSQPHARSFKHKLAPDYCTRIRGEHAHWKAQEHILAEAYMEWKVKGPFMEGEGAGGETEWF